MKTPQDTEAAETVQTKEIPAVAPAATCSACGQVPVQSGRRKVDYGDFSEYEVRRLVAEYCMSVTLGSTGWGLPFKVWVELHGIAKHDGLFRLIRLPNTKLCDMAADNPKDTNAKSDSQ